MAVSTELIERVRRHVGDTAPPVGGVVDEMTSRRYARAIGETNPLYLDEEYARAQGHPGLVVPPNLLPSCMDWTDGGPEEELRRDGTSAEEMTWIPLEGVRLMGGGEDMHFHRPVIAGTRIVLETALEGVDTRETRSGTMLVLTIRHSFTDEAGVPLITTMRTVLGR